MHYHAEVVVADKFGDMEQAIRVALEDYRESEENSHGFWDWYVIGGRWASCKMQKKLGEDRVDKFRVALIERKTTVSSLQCGKQELKPASQIAEVDQLWSEHFPETDGPCPLFSHSNDQYADNGELPGDICRVDALPDGMSCSHFIVVDEDYEKNPNVSFMCQKQVWNGANFEETQWDGTLEQAMELHDESLKHVINEYKEEHKIRLGWLAVTVDYHS